MSRALDPAALRGDFPLLRAVDPIVYLDNACMTLKPQTVIDAVADYYTRTPFCAGRAVYEGSHQVEALVDDARAALATFLGASARATAFTKNATEAINLVAHSFPWRAGDVVLTTDREHNSNLVPWQRLAARGVRHEVVASRPDGTLDIDAWRTRLARGDVRLVSAVHVSNLDGYEVPARDLVTLAHDAGARIMLDGAQAAAHRAVDLASLGADYYAVSVHKMYGPTGVGALLAREEALAELAPFITGGDTVASTTYADAVFLDAPQKFEAGLQNYAGLAGVRAAVDYLARVGMDALESHEKMLAKRVTDGLASVPGIDILGAQGGGIVSLAARGVDAHTLAILLEDKHRILVRSGDHCLHSWFNAHDAPASVRASFGLYNTREEADALVAGVAGLLRQLA